MEVRSYSRAVVRLITGKRSVHARLIGDPSGREEFFYRKASSNLGPAKTCHVYVLDDTLKN
eukprot:scaffold652271_cov52-Prasinocladus_malaysianus.AAC.1